jgi:hypothetical protein
MRISPEQIQALQAILHEDFALDYSDEKTQEAGLAIMRFVIAKRIREKELKKCKNHANTPSFDKPISA